MSNKINNKKGINFEAITSNQPNTAGTAKPAEPPTKGGEAGAEATTLTETEIVQLKKELEQAKKLQGQADRKARQKLLIILIFFGIAILFLIGFNFIVKGGYTPNEIEKWCSMYEKGSDFYLQCKKYMTPYTEEYINKGYAYMKLSLFLLLALLGVIGGIKLYKNKIYKLLIILIFLGITILFLIGFIFIVKSGYTPNEIEKMCSMYYEKGSNFYNECLKYYIPTLREDYRKTGNNLMKFSLITLLIFLGILGGIRLYKYQFSKKVIKS